jgi:hypothetical protein
MKFKKIIKLSLTFYLITYIVSYVIFIPQVQRKLICEDLYGKSKSQESCLDLMESLSPYITIKKKFIDGEFGNNPLEVEEVTTSKIIPLFPFFAKYHAKTEVGLWSTGNRGYVYMTMNGIKYRGISWID